MKSIHNLEDWGISGSDTEYDKIISLLPVYEISLLKGVKAKNAGLTLEMSRIYMIKGKRN